MVVLARVSYSEPDCNPINETRFWKRNALICEIVARVKHQFVNTFEKRIMFQERGVGTTIGVRVQLFKKPTSLAVDTEQLDQQCVRGAAVHGVQHMG